MVVSRAPEKLEIPEEVMAVGGIEEGLRKLQAMYPVLEKRRLEGQERRNEEEQKEEEKLELGRVFVIGGAEIYAHALKLPCCERILWTRIKRDFECDTFFPGGTLLGGGEERGGGKWVVRSAEELREWTGEEAVGGVQREGEVEFEVCMVEREGEGVGEGIGG